MDILIATPGRLMDLKGQKCVELSAGRYFILDEADRMLDMGFLHDVEKIIAALPEKRQTMLFSATMPPEIERLTKSILRDPVRVAVDPVSSTVDSIGQTVYFVNKGNKIKLLIHLLQSAEIYSALVFSRTKHGADKIERYLLKAGEPCGVIHANKPSAPVSPRLERLRPKAKVLIATDRGARHRNNRLVHVINF